MRRANLIIPWSEGLHLRVAAALTRLCKQFRANVEISCEGRVANARSVLSLLTIGAFLDSEVVVEISGEDSAVAMQAIERLFASREILAV